MYLSLFLFLPFVFVSPQLLIDFFLLLSLPQARPRRSGVDPQRRGHLLCIFLQVARVRPRRFRAAVARYNGGNTEEGRADEVDLRLHALGQSLRRVQRLQGTKLFYSFFLSFLSQLN